MLTRNVEAALLLSVLLLTGVASWWLMLRPTAAHDPTAFEALPNELNGWRAFEIEMDESVSEMLGADHNVQRAYVHPLGYQVFVYVGYYGTERGGTPEHTPDICYPSQGWAIAEQEVQRVGGSDGFDLQEFIVQNGDERRLVHFWYRTSLRSGITSVMGLRLNHFWGRLRENRGDGALIRLSTRILDDDLAQARNRLYGMDAVVEEALGEIWPDTDSEPTSVAMETGAGLVDRRAR
ncbi:MAG: exosortase C-terminal domain/associated protein EpsI [Myxococcota bacterium]